jgi:hypothetical protein
VVAVRQHQLQVVEVVAEAVVEAVVSTINIKIRSCQVVVAAVELRQVVEVVHQHLVVALQRLLLLDQTCQEVLHQLVVAAAQVVVWLVLLRVLWLNMDLRIHILKQRCSQTLKKNLDSNQNLKI